MDLSPKAQAAYDAIGSLWDYEPEEETDEQKAAQKERYLELCREGDFPLIQVYSPDWGIEWQYLVCPDEECRARAVYCLYDIPADIVAFFDETGVELEYSGFHFFGVE